MNRNDSALALRAQAGDKLAFSQLLGEHYDMMYRVAYRFCGNRQDAEDIAQEICIKLVDKLESYKGDSAFSTWLYRVVVNACRDYFKSQGARRKTEGGYMDLESLQHADSADTQKKVAWLYRALNQLAPELKETALLVLAEELSHAEAGKILDCAESTISWRMHEVRKQLKLVMDKP